uniref:Uncharacterized protein n=1 Tax=Anguilla anguilla TaxID=7936 RepID=A0A0E9QJC1_ANGAN
MVSIHRPLGYGPSTLPLRHSAHDIKQEGMRHFNHNGSTPLPLTTAWNTSSLVQN